MKYLSIFIIFSFLIFQSLLLVKCEDTYTTTPPTRGMMSISQNRVHAYQEGGGWVSEFNVTIRNNMNVFSVKDVNVECRDGTFMPRFPESDLVGLSKISENKYHFPKQYSDAGGLRPQQTYSFRYVNEGINQANFILANIVFGDSN